MLSNSAAGTQPPLLVGSAGDAEEHEVHLFLPGGLKQRLLPFAREKPKTGEMKKRGRETTGREMTRKMKMRKHGILIGNRALLEQR